MAEALDAALPASVDELAKFVLREACDRNIKLVTAESCTGGLLASLLTDIPGLSHAFERGFVVYSNPAKRELLGVPLEVLETHGAVSEAVARAMAEGALAGSQGDVAVSITGFAEGGRGKTPGLVHFACARTSRPTIHRQMLYGDIGRAEVRMKALQTALEMMRDQIILPAEAA